MSVHGGYLAFVMAHIHVQNVCPHNDVRDINCFVRRRDITTPKGSVLLFCAILEHFTIIILLYTITLRNYV